MPVDSCKEDFKEIKKYFEYTHNIFTPFNPENVSVIKKIHETIYGYLIFKSKLKINNHANIYLDEIQSDYLQLIPLVLRGYEKLAMILLRDILENTLKFIYYFHHPIEFIQLEGKNKNYIFFEELIRYVCEHPDIKAHAEKLQLLGNVKTKYSELSKYVHSKDGNYMHLVKYLQQIKFKRKFSQEFLTELKTIHSIVMTFLILFLHNKYSSISIPNRRFMLNTVSKYNKRYLTSL